jgi:cytochrome P450
VTSAAAVEWPLSIDNPYPDYQRLRATAPIVRLDGVEVPLVLSHPLAAEIVAADEWSSDPNNSPALAARFGMFGSANLEFGSVLMSDPPRHTWLRKAISGYFTPRNIERIRARVEHIVDLALASAEPGEPFDVMANIAYPVPIAVMCELLGAPAEIAPLLRDQTPLLVATLDPLADLAAMEEGAAAGLALMLELVPLVADRRTDPGDDLISALLTEDGGLPPDEVIPLTLILLAAGHETTANLVGNAVIALTDHPDVTRAVRSDLSLLPKLVEELIRYDGPVQLASRIATSDRNVHGIAIGEGEQVLIGLGAANRDPASHPDPDNLRLDRSSGHLGFGHGRHFCAGAALARLEAQEILRRLLDLPTPIEESSVTARRGRSATFRRVEELLIEG